MFPEISCVQAVLDLEQTVRLSLSWHTSNAGLVTPRS